MNKTPKEPRFLINASVTAKAIDAILQNKNKHGGKKSEVIERLIIQGNETPDVTKLNDLDLKALRIICVEEENARAKLKPNSDAKNASEPEDSAGLKAGAVLPAEPNNEAV